MSSPAYTVVVPFPGYSIQLHQTPDEEYKVRARTHVDRREGADQPLGRHDNEEA